MLKCSGNYYANDEENKCVGQVCQHFPESDESKQKIQILLLQTPKQLHV